jgi:hypothetical protein
VPRATGDLDVRIAPSADNADRSGGTVSDSSIRHFLHGGPGRRSVHDGAARRRGTPVVPAEKLALVTEAVLENCDARDGDQAGYVAAVRAEFPEPPSSVTI